MVGHRLMGVSLASTGNILQGRAHLDSALMLNDPAAHRSLATRFGQDVRVSGLSYRSVTLWLLGYPDAALTDVQDALKEAREIGQAAALMYALFFTSFSLIFCGNYPVASTFLDELIALADEKDASQWKAHGTVQQGWILALTQSR